MTLRRLQLPYILAPSYNSTSEPLLILSLPKPEAPQYHSFQGPIFMIKSAQGPGTWVLSKLGDIHDNHHGNLWSKYGLDWRWRLRRHPTLLNLTALRGDFRKKEVLICLIRLRRRHRGFGPCRLSIRVSRVFIGRRPAATSSFVANRIVLCCPSNDL